MLCEGESASSSPEASREEGWRSSLVDFPRRSEAVVRLRLPEPVEEGDDMASVSGV